MRATGEFRSLTFAALLEPGLFDVRTLPVRRHRFEMHVPRAPQMPERLLRGNAGHVVQPHVGSIAFHLRQMLRQLPVPLQPQTGSTFRILPRQAHVPRHAHATEQPRQLVALQPPPGYKRYRYPTFTAPIGTPFQPGNTSRWKRTCEHNNPQKQTDRPTCRRSLPRSGLSLEVCNWP